MTTLTIEQLYAIAAGERGIEGKQQKEIVSRLLAAEKRVAELEAIVNTPVKFTDCDFSAVVQMSGGSTDYCNGFVDGTKSAKRVIEAHGLKIE